MAHANDIAAPIVVLLIAVLIFFIFRALVLWYWRIGEAINLLRSIDEKLGRMTTREPSIDREPYIAE